MSAKGFRLRRALNILLIAILFWIELAVVFVIARTVFPDEFSWIDVFARWTIFLTNLVFAIWLFGKLEDKLNGSRMF
jgi:hypothetical protein